MLFSKAPISIQVEILVKDRIPLESIVIICIELEEKMAEAKATICRTSMFGVNNELFSPNRYKF